MWADAKRQALEEAEKWPYSWLDEPSYHERGWVVGKALLEDGNPAAGGYIVLSNPNSPGDPGQIDLWMRNIGPYQYWTQVAEDGTYKIENVRTGSYRVFLFKPGLFGETSTEPIKVAAGGETRIPDLTLNPVRGGALVWQIGTPDGGATEFRNGQGYHQWDTYTRYREDFPEDIRFIVGESDFKRDWNYIQPAAVLDENHPVVWEIEFDLEEPSEAYLFTVVCGGRNASVDVLVNGTKIGTLDPAVGQHHIRTCPFGEQALRQFVIPGSLLQKGKNEIRLAFPDFDVKKDRSLDLHFQQWTKYIAYDFLRLEELPPTPDE